MGKEKTGDTGPSSLIARMRPAIAPSVDERAEADEFLAQDAPEKLKELAKAHLSLAPRLATIFAASPYLTRLIRHDLDDFAALLETPPETAIDNICGEIAALVPETGDPPDEVELMATMRRLKNRASLVIALADLGGVFDLDAVTGALSAIADELVQAAVSWLFRERMGRGKFVSGKGRPGREFCGYVILAMGKHGARELNFSSDIDLIVFYDPEIAPLGEDVEPSTTFVRLTKHLVRLLQEPTGDGYVYRVDLRLRPDPRATTVAIAIEAAATYYESLGQNWERAAMIKARPIAGDMALGAEFLDRLRPFIWRKYLDYAAIADIHSIKRQIHAFKGHGVATARGHNIKLGRGGIREIEFFVQTQQLIAGGRAPELRGPRTVEMLGLLADELWISPKAAADLKEAYAFLRGLEHRLQMMNDEQTQTLPADEEDFEHFACFAGYENGAGLAEALLARLARVERHYSALFEMAEGLGGEAGNLVFTGGDDDPGTIETLSQMGFQNPAHVADSVRAWHFGGYAATRSARSRQILTELMPALLKALTRASDPDRAFNAFDGFLGGLPAGVQLFSLLHANPKLLNLMADVMGTAPRLSRILGKRPRVLDVVLDPSFFLEVPDRAAYREIVDAEVSRAETYEEALDRARIVGHEQGFRIGVRVLSGTLDPHEAGAAYAGLAEAEIVALAGEVEKEMQAAHGAVPGGAIAIVAMGKLGGEEMAATSDLDLMLIYDCAGDAKQSDGRRPLSPQQYYARLTQRLIAALSAPTAEGALYEVDMRLRPSGHQGPIATHLSSFIDYHAQSSWTWEKMALTRARPLAGDDDLCARVEAAIHETLCRTADRKALAADVDDMRSRIAAEKKPFGPWDLKLMRGGLVDLEFIAQFLQLAHAGESPEVLAPNVTRAFMHAEQAGHLAGETAQTLIEAARQLHALSQLVRLCVEGDFAPEKASEELKTLLSRTVDLPDFDRTEAHVSEIYQSVNDIYNQLIR